jgi:hypothetical protein
VVLGFLGKNRSYLRTRTTTLIKILLTDCCRLYHNYSERDRHPQSHLCNTSCMSSVEQVSCARTCKVSPGRFIPLCHYDTKYTRVCNNMIINAHISMCSNRTKHLRIDIALIPLMGSLHRKQKISYGLQHAKIISRRLLVTVSEGLTLEDRKRDNVPAQTWLV